MRSVLFVVVISSFVRMAAADFYVAPNGSDVNPGTIALPVATVMRAQRLASAGDTVFLRGGTYVLTTSDITRTDGTYAYVNDFSKAGISYVEYPGETPVFDFSAVRPDGLRVTAFFIATNNLHLRGFHVVGVQVTIRAGGAVTNTQSENVRIRNGSGNVLERLVLRDGMGIGVYLIGNSANNLVLSCDAYNNAGADSVSIGNIDGFGSHTTAAGTGNVFRGCRAWLNSDDGFDLINCNAPVVFEQCWAAFNGYVGEALASGADGNGFKAGGYGRNGSALPSPVPRHVVRSCLAVHNRAMGFYANHHAGGLDFVHNTAYRNQTNFNLLNVLADNLTNVPGYDHYLKNNLGFSPRLASVANLDEAACDVSFNFFTLPVKVDEADFALVTTNSAQLRALISAPRSPDGSLPEIDLLRLVEQSDLIDQGQPLAGQSYNLGAPDLGCFENKFVPAPTGLAATAEDGAVTLTWHAVPGTVVYTVSRSAQAGGVYAVVADNLGAVSATDATVTNGVSYFYTVTARNSYGTSDASAPVAARPLRRVVAWLEAFFPGTDDPDVVGLSSDPDRDGRSNLLEYFLASAPGVYDVSPVLELQAAAAGGWELYYDLAKEAPAAGARVEQSSNLSDWAAVTADASTVEDRGDRWRRKISVSGQSAPAFWRLRVELN